MRPWAICMLFLLAMAGCSSPASTCGADRLDLVSWIHPGYAASLDDRVQYPERPLARGDDFRPVLLPNTYALWRYQVAGTWDLDPAAHNLSHYSEITVASYRGLDAAWIIDLEADTVVATIDTPRTLSQDGSVGAEMHAIIQALGDVNATQEALIIDRAQENATGDGFTLHIPGPPSIAHLWRGPEWDLGPERGSYVVRTATPWSFEVFVNGIHVQRMHAPAHDVDLRDRIQIDPAALDPALFPRLERAPQTPEQIIDATILLAALPVAPASDVRVVGDCLPEGAAAMPDEAVLLKPRDGAQSP